MQGWQDDLILALENSQCVEQVFTAVASTAHSLGFDHCAYGIRSPLPITRPKTFMLNNYPRAWQVIYEERCYINTDPTVSHGSQSLTPVIWTEALFERNRELWENAREHGLNHGWSQSSRSAHGALGLLSVCRSFDPLLERELKELEPRLVWLTQYAHIGLSRWFMKDEFPEKSLSQREIEVLRWTADGKTSAEVAEILHLTERTVNFHVTNAATKLSACNKTSAVLRAAMLGLLG